MSKVGLISDSHGRAEITRLAVRLLIDAGADVLIHLGDICDPAVIDSLVEQVDGNGQLDPPVRIVFGNCDCDAADLCRYAEKLGMIADDIVGQVTLDGKIIRYTHGHVARELEKAVVEEVDYLCHGHTHQQRDQRIGLTRVINPGAMIRAKPYTVALLDVPEDQLRFIEVS